jgi:hypothetical protein
MGPVCAPCLATETAAIDGTATATPTSSPATPGTTFIAGTGNAKAVWVLLTGGDGNDTLGSARRWSRPAAGAISF